MLLRGRRESALRPGPYFRLVCRRSRPRNPKLRKVHGRLRLTRDEVLCETKLLIEV